MQFFFLEIKLLFLFLLTVSVRLSWYHGLYNKPNRHKLSLLLIAVAHLTSVHFWLLLRDDSKWFYPLLTIVG